MIPAWYLAFSITTAFLMGMVTYRLLQVIIRYYLKPRPRYRRGGWQ